MSIVDILEITDSSAVNLHTEFCANISKDKPVCKITIVGSGSLPCGLMLDYNFDSYYILIGLTVQQVQF